MSTLPKSYQQFRTKFESVWEAFDKLGVVLADSGPIDEKNRELIKLGMAAANGSKSAVQSHVHRALEAGASKDEIEHSILLGITTIGFPRAMAALTWANEAFQAHHD